VHVRTFESSDLPQLQGLVNLHLSAVVPGWGLSEPALVRHLVRDEAQPITDPWIEERAIKSGSLGAVDSLMLSRVRALTDSLLQCFLWWIKSPRRKSLLMCRMIVALVALLALASPVSRCRRSAGEKPDRLGLRTRQQYNATTCVIISRGT